MVGAEVYDSARSSFAPVSGEISTAPFLPPDALNVLNLLGFIPFIAPRFICPNEKTLAFFLPSGVFLYELLVIIYFF